MYNLIIALFFILSFQQILSQERLITTYNTPEGLPEQTIYDCIQDSLDNMWFVTDNGIIKYNGSEWNYIDTLYSLNSRARASFIRIDNKGTLWVFPSYTQSKIWYRVNENWKSLDLTVDELNRIVSVSAKVVNNSILIVLVTSNSKVIVYTEDSFQYLDISEFENLDINDCVIESTTILFATNEGLYRYNLISKDVIQASNSNQAVLSMDYVKENNSYALLGDSWIGELKNDKIKVIVNVSIKHTNEIFDFSFIKRVDKNTIFFGNMFEFYEYDSEKEKVFTLGVNLGYTTNGATSAFVDREKNVWITSFRGINKIKYSPFVNYYESDGLLRDEVTAIEKFPNGPIILGHNNGLTIWDKKNFRTINFDEQIDKSTFPRVLNLQYDHNKDVVWFNSQTSGIGYLTRNYKIVWINELLANKNYSLSSIFIDDSDKLYYSNQDGVYKFHEGNTTNIITKNILTVRKIARYNDSQLLFASKTGLTLYDEKTNQSLSFTLKNNSYNSLYSLFKLNDKEWLVGSYGGLLIFDGATLKPYKDLEINNPVFFIGKENDFIWFGLMGGVLRWNHKTNEQKLFTTNEGLSGIETNRDAFLFDNEKVYIGTNKGLSVFPLDIYDPSIYKIKPKIHFVDMIDGNNFHYSLSDQVALPFNKNDITLIYNCPSFIDEEQNEYFIQIKNLENNTTEIISTNKNRYGIRNLASGNYILGINAVNANKVSSDTLYTSEIIIKQPFYLEGWFIITLLVISLTVTYTFYNFINRNRYSQKLELEVERRTRQLHQSEQSIRDLTQKLITAQEKERERIARELHDNIAQDLAIIKTEIDSSGENNTRTLSSYNWLSQKINDLTKYVRDMAFFLHPNSIKQTGLLNAIQALCTEYGSYSNIKIDYYSNLPETFQLDDEYQTNIYRFIQESLTNIRKHSNAKNAIVIIVQKDDMLSIRIEDDGVGFDLTEENIHKIGKKMGLKSMEERIKIMDGQLSIKSVLGEGTKIKAQIPIEKKNQSTSSANSDHLFGS